MSLKNSKILVLGASGFIGRNLFEYLKDTGHSVIGQQLSRGYRNMRYMTSTAYLNRIERKFGPETKSHIVEMMSKKIR